MTKYIKVSDEPFDGAHPYEPVSATRKTKHARLWLEGLAITLTTIVAYLGFWRLSPVPTFIIASVMLVLLLVILWRAGKDANAKDSHAPPPAP